MALGGQLLGAEFVSSNDLSSKIPGIRESVRVERDLSNHGVIRDHHGHRPK